MPTRYPDGAARSHGFDKPDRTCLHGIRTGLQDLTGSDITTGRKGLTGSGYQIEHAYEVSGQGCRILRVQTDTFNMPTRYQIGAAGPHG